MNSHPAADAESVVGEACISHWMDSNVTMRCCRNYHATQHI